MTVPTVLEMRSLQHHLARGPLSKLTVMVGCPRNSILKTMRMGILRITPSHILYPITDMMMEKCLLFPAIMLVVRS